MKWHLVYIYCASIACSFLKADFSPEVIQQLDTVFEAALANQLPTGIIAAIWIGDETTWVRAQGLSNIPAKRPLFYSDILRIGSISKTFTTTVLLQLVDEGLLTLDESIERFQLGIPNASQITIRQLCNHTSGLYNYSDDSTLQAALVMEPWAEWTPQQLVQIAVSHPPLFLPGTQVKYNNTNFIIQELIIQQLTGLPLNRAIEARIVQPLRLQNTSLPTNSYLYGQYSRGYVFDDSVPIDFTVLNPSSSSGAGGLISNLKDLKTWVKALATGSLLSPATQQQRLIRVAPPAAPGPFQGPYLRFGLGIEQLGDFTLDENNVFLGHEGDIIAYNCSMNYLPAHDATFIVLTNKNPPQPFPSDTATSIFMSLAKILFPANCPWPSSFPIPTPQRDSIRD